MPSYSHELGDAVNTYEAETVEDLVRLVTLLEDVDAADLPTWFETPEGVPSTPWFDHPERTIYGLGTDNDTTADELADHEGDLVYLESVRRGEGDQHHKWHLRVSVPPEADA